MPEGKNHKHLKEKVREDYEAEGYDTEGEHEIENGMRVDILVENDEERIAIEIGRLH